jgi:hypothetical protein
MRLTMRKAGDMGRAAAVRMRSRKNFSEFT